MRALALFRLLKQTNKQQKSPPPKKKNQGLIFGAFCQGQLHFFPF